MNPMLAIRAYSTAQSAATPTSLPAGNAAPAQGPGFAELVQNVMVQATEQTRGAETQMTHMVQGQGNLIDVVTAISSAEASLETVLSVRDQVISAYKEILSMPI
jgi:flagellar hook-basal body complex protein FliE